MNDNIYINIDYNKEMNSENNHENNKESELKVINLSEYINSLYFFEDIDRYYIINFKKEIMNKIFTIYYLDTFFYSDLFQKMKICYLNENKDAAYGTKKLNYPSKIKNYNNGLEPRMFLKQHNKFFNSKYFPISHPYFIEYIQKNNLYNKSIKLIPKEFPKYLITLF